MNWNVFQCFIMLPWCTIASPPISIKLSLSLGGQISEACFITRGWCWSTPQALKNIFFILCGLIDQEHSFWDSYPNNAGQSLVLAVQIPTPGKIALCKNDRRNSGNEIVILHIHLPWNWILMRLWIFECERNLLLYKKSYMLSMPEGWKFRSAYAMLILGADDAMIGELGIANSWLLYLR